MNQSLIDFCNYIQPIVNSCSGFIKTDGYVLHFPGTIVIMSADETYCSIIHVPIIYDIYITSSINTFLSLKTPEAQSNLYDAIYFTGWNIKRDHLWNYYNLFEGIDNKVKCVYSEPDCYNIQNFGQITSKTDIRNVYISDGEYNYMIPASKSITPLNKSDTVSLKIYDYVYNPDQYWIKTVRYTLFKKKFKLSVDIFSNIIVV